MLRVFVAPDGSHGNPLGVFLDGRAVAADRRQAVAADLGFSETVFVDDTGSGTIRIFTPALELPFAGHPCVGASWLLAQERAAVPMLHTRAGAVPSRVEGVTAFIAGRPEWAPEFELIELADPAEVDALTGPPGNSDLAAVYSVVDDANVRARVFPRRLGIEEDEATGAAAITLGARLGRPVTIRQGLGSVICVRPLEDGRVEIGGRVVLDDRRSYDAG